MLPSFFTACKTKDESISTRFLIENSFLKYQQLILLYQNRIRLSIHQMHSSPGSTRLLAH
jgi:hypothetical protein